MNPTLVPTVHDTPWSTPGTPGYAEAVATYNVAAAVRPAGAVVARSADDVSRAVRAARRAGLGIRVHTTGHAARAKKAVDGSVLIRTDLSESVRIDPERRTARIPAGARWAAVVAAAATYGLVALHGSSPTVGAIGYLLRGGLSFYGRHFGVAANHVRSITLVLADGRLVTADQDSEPELFWALRGGGGGFGIVTEIEIDLFEMSEVITGALFFDARDAEAIAPLWRAWTTQAPTTVSTSLRLMNLPPLPGVPAVLTGGQVLALDGAVMVRRSSDLGSAAAVAADLLEPLRSAATPLLDTWHVAPPAELPLTHMDPPEPLPYTGTHALLRDFGDEGLHRFLHAAGAGSGSVLAVAELRQLGGAFTTPERAGGAFDRIDADFALLAVGIDVPGVTGKVREDLGHVTDATAPCRSGLTAPTFVEEVTDRQRTFDDATAARVTRVRRVTDPDGVFIGDVEPIRDHAAS